MSELLNDNIISLYLKNNNITKLIFNDDFSLETIDTLDLSNNNITDISALDKIKIIELLSLENNENLSNYNITSNVYFLNLANTGIDDSFAEKVDYEKIGVVNLSLNKNILDYDKLVYTAYDKIAKLNEELKNKYIEENEIEIDFYENEEYLSANYVNVHFIISDHTLKTLPNPGIFMVGGNYELTLEKDSNGVINLVSKDNINVFRLINTKDYNYNIKLYNLELDKSKTKLKVLGPNAYMKLYCSIRPL